jgi:hypothetical protein
MVAHCAISFSNISIRNFEFLVASLQLNVNLHQDWDARNDRETGYPPTYITIIKQQGGTEAYLYIVQVIYLDLNVYKDHLRDDQSYHHPGEL